MRKAALAGVLLGIGLIFLGTYLIGLTLDKVEKEKKGYELYMGETVVIQRDTLKVVDYNVFLETFTLSDESKMAKEAIIHYIIIEDE